ncbi:MAG: dienelactone hydrolase family protein [Allosphingosinicella sp.]
MLAGAAAFAACTTAPAAGGARLVEERVRIATPDGTMDAFFVRPADGRHPAILTWPDIAGLREAFEVMARRLAGQGYAVLVVNPYYRAAPSPQFSDFAAFRAAGGFEKVGPWRAALTADAIRRDATAAVAWLNRRREVDRDRGVGTHGYCMGGPFTVWTAAAVPQRVRAAASLHGGGLVRPDDPQSPHALLDETQARYLFAISQDDDAKAPDVKTALRDAAAAAGRPAEIEVYPADHGWTVIDSPAYDAAAAERAWTRMSALFATL